MASSSKRSDGAPRTKQKSNSDTSNGSAKRLVRFQIPRGASDEDLQKLADTINEWRRRDGHSSKG